MRMRDYPNFDDDKCECEYVEFDNPTPKYGYKGVNVIVNIVFTYDGELKQRVIFDEY